MSTGDTTLVRNGYGTFFQVYEESRTNGDIIQNIPSSLDL